MALAVCRLFSLLTTAVGKTVFHVGMPMPDVEPVPPNFVGFSVEVQGIRGMIGKEGLQEAYAQVLRNLASLTAGPHAGPVLRIGGNSADYSCFDGGAPADKCKYNITEADLKAYRTFATKTAGDVNISYVIDVNFGLSSDAWVVATKHIAAINDAGLWSIIKAVEIGNEMDNYASHAGIPGKPQHRDSNYTFADYESDFKKYVSALDAVGLPAGASIQGGTFSSTKGDWGLGIRSYIKRWASRLRSMSLHSYSKTACYGKSTTPEEMISEASCAAKARHFREYIDASRSQHVEFVIGEGNSASCGGVPGVSDTFASTLWVLDFLPEISKNGASGMNFHGGPRGIYPAIAFGRDNALEIRPLYYGLLAFSTLVANHSRWLNVHASNTPTGDPMCKGGILSGISCCAAECGKCGGIGCTNRPGGRNACCAGFIKKKNASCSTNGAPCVINPTFVPATVAHVVKDGSTGEFRALLIARSHDDQDTQICFDAEIVAATTIGMLSRLEAPELTSKMGDAIKWRGQTFDGSVDGLPLAEPSEEMVEQSSRGCFDVRMPPMSASVLRVQVPGTDILYA